MNIEELEYESDSDDVGEDMDMDRIPEDANAEDSDEVIFDFFTYFKVYLNKSFLCAKKKIVWIWQQKYFDCKESKNDDEANTFTKKLPIFVKMIFFIEMSQFFPKF